MGCLPPKKRQELDILQRTKTLLFGKLEKLLNMQVHKSESLEAPLVDPEMSAQVEELSSYIERVEQ